MARIRSIKPEYWADFDTATTLSRDARLLYISLWNFADEHARIHGDCRYVKGQCFPYDDDLTPEVIDVLLADLERAGKVVRYVEREAPYLFLPRLAKHQRLEAGKVPSRLPPPPDPDGPGSGADESAPDPDESGTNVAQQVAGSKEQAAGSKRADANHTPPQPVDNQLPDDLAILRSKLNTHKLIVRWDRLTPEAQDEISELIQTHGDAALVKAALNSFQPNNPPVFAQAWLNAWRAIPAPGSLRVIQTPCPEPGHQGTTTRCGDCIIAAKIGDNG